MINETGGGRPCLGCLPPAIDPLWLRMVVYLAFAYRSATFDQFTTFHHAEM